MTKFSITGYSLGGLYARYVIAILQQNNFFNKVQPVNFATIATPHIGIPRSPGSLFSRIVRAVGANMLGSTGQQLYALDDWAGTGRPLLEVMADKGAYSESERSRKADLCQTSHSGKLCELLNVLIYTRTRRLMFRFIPETCADSLPAASMIEQYHL